MDVVMATYVQKAALGWQRKAFSSCKKPADLGSRAWLRVAAAMVYGLLQALCATSYMLLALLQPWRLLSSLPLIDTSSQAVSIIIPVSATAAACLGD